MPRSDLAAVVILASTATPRSAPLTGPGGAPPALVKVDASGGQLVITSGGFLVEPVGLVNTPEPGGTLMLLSGLALLVALRRGRAAQKRHIRPSWPPA